MPDLSDSVNVIIPNAKLKLNDKVLKYRIYSLSKALMPNDSIKINYKLEKITKGFENEVSFTQLTQNGSFFNSSDITPTIGYDDDIELADNDKRSKFKLPKRLRMAKLEPDNLIARSNNYFHNDYVWANATTTISTSVDQIAVAPGSLIKSWKAADRNYFTYKLDHKSLAFFSFISARYELARKEWNGIDLKKVFLRVECVPPVTEIPARLTPTTAWKAALKIAVPNSVSLRNNLTSRPIHKFSANGYEYRIKFNHAR